MRLEKVAVDRRQAATDEDAVDVGECGRRHGAGVLDRRDARLERAGRRCRGDELARMIVPVAVADRDDRDARQVAPGCRGASARLVEEGRVLRAVRRILPAATDEVHAHAAPSANSTGGSADQGKTIQSSVRRYAKSGSSMVCDFV